MSQHRPPPESIGSPDVADAAALGRVHLTAWLQTYPNREAGIDEAWIREHVGSVVTADGIAQWRTVIEAAQRDPRNVFCRVVRSDGEIVGLICGKRGDVTSLGPMYLLDQAQRQGIGSRLMSEFLAWAGNVPIRLWVTSYNERAVNFYARHGFVLTDERELWRGKLPNVRMFRGPE
ncbi:GNAT family N-acetyltransferase [Streptosporangium sp. NPDC000396]|uniref:GNAT family N-acetyltransferase n=1 Tax=Streptosporangium sp. NPDC000396 TaxID=3366185 RepID=UPI0036847BF1